MPFLRVPNQRNNLRSGNLSLSTEILGRVGRVNRIQRHDAERFPQIVALGHFMWPARRHQSSPNCLWSAGAPGAVSTKLNGRLGDRPESSKN